MAALPVQHPGCPAAAGVLVSMSLAPMIPQFALRLIVGLSVTWCLLPRQLITSGFFRIQLLLTLGLSVLVALTSTQWDGLPDDFGLPLLRWGAVVAAGMSFVGSVLWTLERRRSGTVLAVAVAIVSTAMLLALQASPAPPTAPGWLRMNAALTSAGLLGTLTGAMLLGHWYLTAAGMSLTPLVRATQLALTAVLLRGVTAGVATASAGDAIRSALGHEQQVWTLLRWTAGIVGPLVLTGMTFGTLRYRNTQSATGVLFAAVILAFIGEAAALLLLRELQWPL